MCKSIIKTKSGNLNIILAFVITVVICFGLAAVGAAIVEGDDTVEISTVVELLDLSGKKLDGNYKLTADIDLSETEFVGIQALNGTFDGNGHSVTLNIKRNGKAAFIWELGTENNSSCVKNLTVKGNISGGSNTAAIAASAIGTIENCRVEADIVSSSISSISAFANCNGKNSLTVKNCVFAGSVTYNNKLNYQSNYLYFGIFLGYNGGALGGGKVVDSRVEYSVRIPSDEYSDIAEAQYYNCNTEIKEESCDIVGDIAEITYSIGVKMDTVGLNSLSDQGIMSNFGAPVVRLLLGDGTYRYLDGFDKSQSKFVSDFGNKSIYGDKTVNGEEFVGMYEYEDISSLTAVLTGSQSVSIATSTYGYVEISTAKQFESFARLINSAVPCQFTVNGVKKSFSILNSLTLGIKLEGDVDLTERDRYGNESEFYGIGKQEFFPYRAGIDGNGHSITVDIDAPNGYMIGILSNISEMANDIVIKDLTVNGSIVGSSKVGIVAYHDLVCNAYVSGGMVIFDNVTNNADITGKRGVGGLLGVTAVSKAVISAKLIDCENNGNITITSGGDYGGGLVGTAGFYGQIIDGVYLGEEASVSIENCVNNGSVTAPNSSCHGGIVGMISGDLSVFRDTFNNGTVNNSGAYSGELVGYSGSIEKHYSESEPSAESAVGWWNVKYKKDGEYLIGFNSVEAEIKYTDKEPDFLKSTLDNYSMSKCFDYYIEYTSADGDVYGQSGDKTFYDSKLKLGQYTCAVYIFENNDNYFSVGKIDDCEKVGKSENVISAMSLTVVRNELGIVISDEQSAAYNLGDENNKKKVTLADLPRGAEWSVSYYDDDGTVFDESGVVEIGSYREIIKIIIDDAFFIDSEDFLYYYGVDERYFSDVIITFSVTVPIITIVVGDVTVEYGDEEPSYSFTAEGYYSKDFLKELSKKIGYNIVKFETIRVYEALNAGTYFIRAYIDGAENFEYEFVFIDGTMKITKADYEWQLSTISEQVKIKRGVDYIIVESDIEGLQYSVTLDGSYVYSGVKIEGLNSSSEYTIYLKVAETANYNESMMLSLGKVATKGSIFGIGYPLFFCLIGSFIAVIGTFFFLFIRKIKRANQTE